MKLLLDMYKGVSKETRDKVEVGGVFLFSLVMIKINFIVDLTRYGSRSRMSGKTSMQHG